jgi:GT2 family glycosyltransferase
VSEAAAAGRVDVIIVAHNAGALLDAAVDTAAAQAGPDRVWVMDAESTDGSVEALAARDTGARIVAVPNRGFAASNNRGIEAASAEFVLLLNPDAELRPGALDALVAAAGAAPRAAIVGALIENPDGTVQAESYGRFPTLLRQIGARFRRLGNRLAGNAAQSPPRPAHVIDVDWVTGAGMLVRRAAIDEVGGLDEGYFLYYEDVDWAHRMKDAGWRVLVEPRAVVVHHLGGSGAPSVFVQKAYREAFYRYCDTYGLWGLAAFARVGLAIRTALGGRG